MERIEGFRFDIGTKVWFQYLGLSYEGTIVKQVYTRKLNRADDRNWSEDCITSDKTYYAECSAGLIPFEDYDFHKKVFIDKKLFLETVIIHK